MDLGEPGDLFSFTREAGGFGQDTTIGFDDDIDRIAFVGYHGRDLIGVDTTSEPSAAQPGLIFTTWHFSFADGSGLTVQVQQQEVASPPERGQDYVLIG